MERKFSSVKESQITRAIVREFSKEFVEYAESDCIIVGAGPSGLIAGRELAKKGVKVVIIESNNYLGGGFWLGAPQATATRAASARAASERRANSRPLPHTKLVQQGLRRFAFHRVQHPQ